MPPMGDALHSLSACFEDRVELGALLDHLPGSLEAGRYHEPFAGAEFPALTGQVFERDAAPGQAAELGFRIPDAPRAG